MPCGCCSRLGQRQTTLLRPHRLWMPKRGVREVVVVIVKEWVDKLRRTVVTELVVGLGGGVAIICGMVLGGRVRLRYES